MVRVDSVRFVDVKNTAKPYKSTTYFQLNSEADSLLALTPAFYSFFNSYYFTDSTRTNTIEFPYKMNEKFIFNIQFPEGIHIENIPEAARLSFGNQYGSFLYQTSNNNRKLQITIDIELRQTEYPVPVYPTLQNFLNQVADKLNEVIILKNHRD